MNTIKVLRNTKSLKIIQVLSKIGQIASRVAFILNVVGFGISATCLLTLGLGALELPIDGVSLESLLTKYVSESTAYAAVAIACVCTAFAAVTAQFCRHYFTRELADGTPFTLGGAKELFTLGILTFVFSIGCSTVCGVVIELAEEFFGGTVALTSPDFAPIGGVMLILISLLCRCGAELLAEKSAE